MNDRPELVYASVRRTVVAMDRLTGRRIWSVKLPFLGGHISMTLANGPHLYIGRRSSVTCLDRFSGGFRWRQELDHSGLVLLSAAGAEIAQQVAAAHQAAAAAASKGASTATTGSAAGAATVGSGGGS